MSDPREAQRERDLHELFVARGELAAAFQRVPDSALSGFSAGDRNEAFAGLESTHDTSPADVIGWLADHYREHVPQITQLAAAAPKS